MQLHRVGWVYIILALVFSVVGASCLVEAQTNLAVPLLWIVSNAMLFVVAYHANAYWETSPMLGRDISLLYLLTLVVSTLWADSRRSPESDKSNGVLPLICGILFVGYNPLWSLPFWVGLGYIAFWFGFTLWASAVY